METVAYKVFGTEGHRQRVSFDPSVTWNWSNNNEGTRLVEVFGSDVTGTNDYTIIRITRDTLEDCLDEFDGQYSDGVFENSRVSGYERIENPKEIEVLGYPVSFNAYGNLEYSLSLDGDDVICKDIQEVIETVSNLKEMNFDR